MKAQLSFTLNGVPQTYEVEFATRIGGTGLNTPVNGAALQKELDDALALRLPCNYRLHVSRKLP